MGILLAPFTFLDDRRYQDMMDRWGWLDRTLGASQGMVALDEDDEIDEEEWEDEDEWDDDDDEEWDDEEEDEEDWDEWYDDDEALLDPRVIPADWS